MAVKFKSTAKLTEVLNHLQTPLEKFTDKGYTLDCGISEIRVYAPSDNLICTIKPGVLISSILTLPLDDSKAIFIRNLVETVYQGLPAINDPTTYDGGNALYGKVCDADWYQAAQATQAEVKVPDGVHPPVPVETAFSDMLEKLVLGLEGGTPEVTSHAAPNPAAPSPAPASPEDVTAILAAPPVSLSEATRLYQPVRGTSADSRYYVVGISKSGLRIAVKKPNHTLSIRVEPKSNVDAETSKRLKHFGLAEKDGHYSGHFTLSHTTAPRFVGALLADVSSDWVTGMPNLSVLESAL